MSRFKPHPLNAPGDFYVVDGECITCMAPESEAPELLGYCDDEDHGPHCFFKKQPSTETEVCRAIDALEVSCCGALRYSGTDLAIISALKKRKLSEQID